MEEVPIDLLLNSESTFYLGWKGAVLGMLLTAAITWGFSRIGSLAVSSLDTSL